MNTYLLIYLIGVGATFLPAVVFAHEDLTIGQSIIAGTILAALWPLIALAKIGKSIMK